MRITDFEIGEVVKVVSDDVTSGRVGVIDRVGRHPGSSFPVLYQVRFFDKNSAGERHSGFAPKELEPALADCDCYYTLIYSELVHRKAAVEKQLRCQHIDIDMDIEGNPFCLDCGLGTSSEFKAAIPEA